MTTDSIVEYIEKNFSQKRKVHTEGVRQTAIKLAQRYGADEKKAEIAALYHDMYRGVPETALNYYVKYLNMPEKYMNNPNLAHSKVAAFIMERDYDIHDQEILDAVSFHTTGRAGMGLLEKIIYIADAIEPGRNYPGVEEIREAAERDIDEACLLSLSNTISFVTGEGKFLDEDTVYAKEYFENLLEKKENSDDQ